MNRNARIVAFAVGGLLLLQLLLTWYAPKPVEWTESFTRLDKIPYGCYVLFDLLPALIKPDSLLMSDKTIYETLAGMGNKTYDYPDESPNEENLLLNDSVPHNYLFINHHFAPDSLDTRYLLAWVAAGNTAFISANSFSEGLSDTLHFETDYNYTGFFSDTNALKTRLELRAAKFQADTLLFKKDFAQESVYFSHYDSAQVALLGVDRDTLPNFIMQPFGKGRFFLHTMPHAFTNYHILQDPNHRYIAGALSYLPAAPTYWDDYYKVGRNLHLNDSIFRYFLSVESLRWMLYLSLGSVLLFILFQAKRRQRVIPIVVPPANATLAFTKTVGLLYLQNGDHRDLLEKKTTYLLDFIRQRYFLKTNTYNEAFYDELAAKSGVEKTLIVQLFGQIAHIKQQPSGLSDQVLLDFNRLIEQFYAQTAGKKITN